jgi:uncharacterized protein with PQ loop repeat
MDTTLVGFIATSSSVLAFGSQFVHTLQSKTTSGLSLYRTIFDVVSLALWVYYAARVEDNPLLIATALELFTSACVFILIVKEKKSNGILPIKQDSPPPTPETDPKSLSEVIVVPTRRFSV